MPADGSAAPLTVSDATKVKWDDEADVVVIGFGGAGTVTCLQARELGATVIAVDRFVGGGSVAYSGGVMYAGGGTQYQSEAGFNDTAEEMYKYLSAEGSALSASTLRRFCEGSKSDFEWIEGHGVPRGGNAFLDKVAFPPDPHWLYYSGNEQEPAFAAVATPAPRGHRVATPGPGGHLHYDRLRSAALAQGVKLIRHAPVKRLVVDMHGRVIGVEANALPEGLWKKHEKQYSTINPWLPYQSGRFERAAADARALEDGVDRRLLIHARKGVVLATGGFIQNRNMLGEYRPQLEVNYSHLLRLASLGDDGSGIDLGKSVGGVTAWMDRVPVGRSVAPPNAFVNGILVNVPGTRFINEAAHAMGVGTAIANQEAGTAWLILRAQDFWTGVRHLMFPVRRIYAPLLLNVLIGGTRRAATLRRLARKIGISAVGLESTVAAYNSLADSHKPDPLGKEPELIHPLTEGPFWAINLSLHNRFAPMIAVTMGGLVLDEQTGAVKRQDGSLVSGLYAAGRVGIGLCTKVSLNGLSIADTVFGGRRAGRAAATVNADGANRGST